MKNPSMMVHATPSLLSPYYADRVARLPSPPSVRPAPVPVVPIVASHFSDKIHLVQDQESSRQMLEVAQQRALSYIGIDTEFQYLSLGVVMGSFQGRDLVHYDPRSIRPLLLAIAMVESAGGPTTTYRFAVDLRCEVAVVALGKLLALPIPFIGHFLQAELFCLWTLGLPTPDIVWDTWTAEKVFSMGLYHARYVHSAADDAEDGVVASRRAEEEELHRFSLLSTCLRHGVDHPHAAHKDRLQQSFLVHAAGDYQSRPGIEPFSRPGGGWPSGVDAGGRVDVWGMGLCWREDPNTGIT